MKLQPLRWVALDQGKRLQGVTSAPLPREVFFSNAPYSTTEESLRDIFSSCGEVLLLELFKRNGESKGMGVVTFQVPSLSEFCVKKG